MSSSNAPRPEASVLERNLALLLTRAYVPVEPSIAYRTRLQRALELDIAARVRARRSGVPRPGARIWILRSAAALLCALLGAFAWKALSAGAPHESRRAALERIAGGGHTAIATDAAGSARAVSREEAAHGLEYRGPALTAWTAESSDRPQAADLIVWLGAGDRSGGRLRVRPATRVDLAGAPESALSLDLEGGAIELERYAAGGTWQVRTREGDIELERGTLLVALAPLGSNPDAPSAESERGVSVLLRSGSAYVARNGQRIALALDTETVLRSGSLVAVSQPLVPLRDPSRDGSGRTALSDTDPGTSPDPAPVAKPTGALHGVVTRAPESVLPERYSITLLRDERLPNVAQPKVHTIEGGQSEFTLAGLRPGTYSVFAAVRGFAVWQRRGVVVGTDAVPSEIAIDLQRGQRVGGRVIDADSGRPIEGAVVISQRDAPAQVLALDMKQVPEGWISAALSGPDGRFEIDALSLGVHHLRATHAGFGAGWSEALDVRPGIAHDDVELRLQRGGAVFGHVTYKDGRPWTGAVIIASRIEYGFDQHVMSYGAAITDAEGAYTIEDLPAGPYVVLNALEPSVERVASPHVTQINLAVGARVEVDLGAARKGTQLSGRIVGAGDATRAGLDVILEPHAAHMQGRKWQSERARADGTFRFADLSPGAYDVYVSEEMGKRFVLQDEVEVPAVPDFAYELRLGAGEIRGRILDAASQRGLPNCVIILEVDVEGGHIFAGRVLSDSEGRYAVHHLPAGSYRVTAFATTGRFGPESRAGLQVDATRAALEVDIPLALGAALDVKVVGQDGRPVQGAGVTVTDETGQCLQFTPEDVTDAHGKFSINGIKPGRWNVSVTTVSSQAGGSHAGATTVDLQAGSDGAVEIVLTPTEPR